MKFFNDGKVNFPYLSDGMWFLTQHKRWGLLKDHPDYLAVAKQVNKVDLFKEAASAMGVSVPKELMRSKQADRWRGLGWQRSQKYADGFQDQGLIPGPMFVQPARFESFAFATESR